MTNNSKKTAKNIVIIGISSVVAASTLKGVVCSNLQCPEYMCEKHEHLPEKGDTGVSYAFGGDASVGTPSPSASDNGDYPYVIYSQTEGGEKI